MNMSKHPLYGLLYIILLPFALVLGLSILISLPVALGVPIFLISVFVMACFVIYTIATLIFYVKAVQQQKPCKPSLRDWIRVNTFVIIIPTGLFILNCTVVILQPSLINNVIDQFKQIQQQEFPFSPGAIKAMVYFILVYAVAVFIHIIYTFRLLRIYKASFGDESSNV